MTVLDEGYIPHVSLTSSNVMLVFCLPVALCCIKVKAQQLQYLLTNFPLCLLFHLF